jgi:hypothetical protein
MQVIFNFNFVLQASLEVIVSLQNKFLIICKINSGVAALVLQPWT